jgi:hypothetical protein
MLGATAGDRVRRQASARKRALALWATKQGIPLVTAAHSGHAAAVGFGARRTARKTRTPGARAVAENTPCDTRCDDDGVARKVGGDTAAGGGRAGVSALLCSLARDLRRVSRASPSGAELAN